MVKDTVYFVEQHINEIKYKHDEILFIPLDYTLKK